ncbi:MAG: hypothetical protein F6K19_32625 [Cyanothece sp. SIO1E1]|nr:hypothetical protein [Cyanothece sp. SIO1E1]
MGITIFWVMVGFSAIVILVQLGLRIRRGDNFSSKRPKKLSVQRRSPQRSPLYLVSDDDATVIRPARRKRSPNSQSIKPLAQSRPTAGQNTSNRWGQPQAIDPEDQTIQRFHSTNDRPVQTSNSDDTTLIGQPRPQKPPSQRGSAQRSPLPLIPDEDDATVIKHPQRQPSSNPQSNQPLAQNNPTASQDAADRFSQPHGVDPDDRTVQRFHPIDDETHNS